MQLQKHSADKNPCNGQRDRKTCLGLSIAKDLLDRNGGSIDIRSEVGKGTEVVIKIPTKTMKQ